jgi:hypothetical protein
MNITLELDSNQYKDLTRYCGLNKFIPEEIAKKSYLEGFTIEKYGLLGKTHNNGEKGLKTGGIQEKRVEIEVIREKRVEIPVEVIKEVIKVEYVEVPVEVIKEVTVDKIVEVIKEVPVEKIVTIYDNSNESELLLKIQQLENQKQEFSTKVSDLTNELQKFSTITQENKNIFQDKIKELESREPERIEIIKEVVVEKTTTDNSKQKALEETIQKIRTELQLKNKEINDLKNTITEIQSSNGRQGIFLDGSNLNRTINNRK